MRFGYAAAALGGGLVVGALSAAVASHRSGLGDWARDWWRHRPTERLCYRTKTEALQAFRDANRKVIDRWGGLDVSSSPAEFDAINHKYGLRGRREVRTLAQALWAAMPSHRPFCLDAIDIEALNETSPGQQGNGFTLPTWAYDIKAARDEVTHYRRAS